MIEQAAFQDESIKTAMSKLVHAIEWHMAGTALFSDIENKSLEDRQQLKKHRKYLQRMSYIHKKLRKFLQHEKTTSSQFRHYFSTIVLNDVLMNDRPHEYCGFDINTICNHIKNRKFDDGYYLQPFYFQRATIKVIEMFGFKEHEPIVKEYKDYLTRCVVETDIRISRLNVNRTMYKI